MNFFIDAVVRTSYYKYYHPKEALVANGVLNRAVAIAAGKAFPTGSEDENNLQYVYKRFLKTHLGKILQPIL